VHDFMCCRDCTEFLELLRIKDSRCAGVARIVEEREGQNFFRPVVRRVLCEVKN
jgi:hypothetical protein